MNKQHKKLQGIARLMLLAKNEANLMLLLDDLLTSKEIDQIHERVKIIECLMGGLPQREASQKSGVAIATVTRGARLLQKPHLFITHIIKKAQGLSWWRPLFWQA